MSAKHSSAPWRVEVESGDPVEIQTVVMDAGDFYIATVHKFGHGDVAANARLIAAAPDLLAACVEFVRKCDEGEARSKCSYTQMRAAIAKAEGAA